MNVLLERLATEEEQRRVANAAREAASRHGQKGQDYARAAFYGALWGAAFLVVEKREASGTPWHSTRLA